MTSATNDTSKATIVQWCVLVSMSICSFTSLNIVKHVERSFENPYIVWWCNFKAMGELVKKVM